MGHQEDLTILKVSSRQNDSMIGIEMLSGEAQILGS